MKNKKIPIYPKMLSVFIKELQAILDKDGDMPVATYDSESGYTTTRIFPEVIPWYYDGGYVVPCDNTVDAHGHEYAHMHYISSKQSDEKGMSIPHPSLEKEHMAFVRIRYQIPIDLYSTLDGKPFKQRWVEDGNEPFWEDKNNANIDMKNNPILSHNNSSLHRNSATNRHTNSIRVFGSTICNIYKSGVSFFKNYSKKDRK